MKYLILIAVFAASATLGFSQLEKTDSEEAAVRAALQHYLDGHATGMGSHHEQVFHKEAKLFWVRDGQLNQRTSTEYIAGASGSPADNEAERNRWISSVDISGNAAVGKIVLDYPGAYITDYMSLLKIDGEWKIVNKISDVKSTD